MKELYKSLPEYIESGKYFIDARNWYKYKYIHPFSQRSFIFLLSSIICVLFIGVLINLMGLFPSVIPVKYSVTAVSSANKSAQIIRADQVNNDPLSSVADIMLRNYVLKREYYKYEDLKKQFIYIKNNSTRIVFRRFYNFMNIDNPNSPIMTLQKKAKRVAEIIDVSYPSATKAIITFKSLAEDFIGKSLENKVWQATINYEIDEINPNLPNGTRFNFTVTNYQLKLLEDKNISKLNK